LLAIIQFCRQSPVGLFKVGEQHIGLSILGIAKIVSGGTTYIRGYGTFPHPNPLSAVITAGIFIILYLLLASSSIKAKTTYSILLFLNILGLTVTFSRGAYLALAFGLLIFFGYLMLTKVKTISLPILVTLASILISFVIFKPFLLTRETFSDQSTVDRKFYDVTGVKMAQHNPIFGLGLGESVLHMEQYSGKTLQPWDKQPPHNYFIIAAAELGIPAALILLWFFLSQLKSLIFNLKSKFSTYRLALITIFSAFLVLMMFDHYFYTLEQTQLLLWFILAMITLEIKNPQTGD
jgi:putative inorganic carbon (HCO3(-)) transporter